MSSLIQRPSRGGRFMETVWAVHSLGPGGRSTTFAGCRLPAILPFGEAAGSFSGVPLLTLDRMDENSDWSPCPLIGFSAVSSSSHSPVSESSGELVNDVTTEPEFEDPGYRALVEENVNEPASNMLMIQSCKTCVYLRRSLVSRIRPTVL